MRDLLGSDGLHLGQRLSVLLELGVEEVLQVARDEACEVERRVFQAGDVGLVDALVAQQSVWALGVGHEELAWVRLAVLLLQAGLRERRLFD